MTPLVVVAIALWVRLVLALRTNRQLETEIRVLRQGLRWALDQVEKAGE